MANESANSHPLANAEALRRLVFRSRFVAVILFGMGFVGGLAIIRVGVRQTWEAWNSSDWSRVAGVITAADTSFDTRTHTEEIREGQTVRGQREVTTDVWSPELTYTFEVAGTAFMGHRIGVADVATDQYSQAREVVARYAPGTAVTVYVHPDDPTLSVLEPGITFGAVGPIIIGSVVCFCMGCMLVGVCSRKFVSLVQACNSPPAAN